MDSRQIKGLAIISKGDLPVVVDEEHFTVPSQSGNGNYEVSHVSGWQCSCPDFVKNQKPCKHIHAIEFFLKMKNKVELDDFNIEEELNKEECPHCHSEDIAKNGLRKTTSGIRQRFKCNACKKRFTLEPIKHTKANAKIICLTMDLYYKGLSLRDISDTVFQFYGLRIHFDTIRRWIQKFSKKIDDYTSALKPELSGIINTDEQMVKSKGKWVWAWNSIDNKTKFVLASTVSQKRTIASARKHFQEVKQKSQGQKPAIIITDGLESYRQAIKKEFKTYMRKKETQHLSIVNRRKVINNNQIERYHNDFREFDKIKRGFKSNATTQEWTNGFRNYHNFIHENSGIGMTPAEASGIKIITERNKWLNLIKQSRN